MKELWFIGGHASKCLSAGALLLFWQGTAFAVDWPQYRGPNMDGISTEPILTSWPVGGPPVVWRNGSLSNGFSCLAISQGRVFAQVSKDVGGGVLGEFCVAVNAATGANLWATQIGAAPWALGPNGNGGGGYGFYDSGDGPRSTPSVKDGRVYTLCGLIYPEEMILTCLNATNGSIIWTNDLLANYGASTIGWDNGASPCLDNDLVYVNLHTANNNQTLAAFQTSDGSMAWSTQNEQVTHTTPIITTLYGMRQVIFATQTGLVSLNRTNGDFLWKFPYPWTQIDTSMGAGPIVYSNLVYCTAAYARGDAVAQITLSNNTWTATQVWTKSHTNGQAYSSIWMTPVCYQGYIYTLCGENSTFLVSPLSCIELATGNLKWSTNNFGMGGLILVNSNLLVQTEDGKLVLARCNPNAYSELARFQAFQFSNSAHGKCWQHPTFSDGHIYAHSVREGISVDVSLPPALKLLAPRFLNATQVQLTVSTVNGAPIASNRMAKIEVHATNTLAAPSATWPKLTNPLVLGTNGIARMTNTFGGLKSSFFMTVEVP